MPSDLASLRAELRELRKQHVKPVSKMRKGDISEEVRKLRETRETTPPVAAVPSAPVKELHSVVETVKEAKKKEFPVAPAEMPKKKVSGPKSSSGSTAAAKGKKDVVAKKVSKADLMRLLEKMSDDE